MRREPFPHEFEYLLTEALNVCEEIHDSISKLFSRAPETIKLKVAHPNKPADNPLRIFDSEAEEWFKTHMKLHFREPLVVVGEEDPLLAHARYAGTSATVLLVDMVDGSDLAMTGMGNWCSAIVCFSPVEERIIMTVVAHANGRRYFASSDGAYVEIPIEIAGSRELLRRRVRLHVGTKVKTMSEARICCYGQKWKKMLAVDEKFYRALGTNGRFYNLAGNPMMVKVAEGQIDAVFEIGGQKPYDVVPGAYIAMKAGAMLLTPQGKLLTESDLYQACLVPNSELRYILAGTKELADELQSYLATAKTLGEKTDG